MIKIRLKFSKWGSMKFIGHLDMMRYFQKAMRRAEIDICYSEGFSPHMIMSFAAPLGVGITSEGEYFDIEVNSSYSSEEAMRRLNAAMVEGVAVTGYVELPENAKTAMSIVNAADYTLSYKEGYESPFTYEEWEKILEEEFRNQEEFLITKKTKKGEREVDLKPLIYSLDLRKVEDQPVFYLLVSTGSIDNIKPELLLEALYTKKGLAYNEASIQIHRIDTYTRTEEGNLIPLLAMGEVVK